MNLFLFCMCFCVFARQQIPRLGAARWRGRGKTSQPVCLSICTLNNAAVHMVNPVEPGPPWAAKFPAWPRNPPAEDTVATALTASPSVSSTKIPNMSIHPVIQPNKSIVAMSQWNTGNYPFSKTAFPTIAGAGAFHSCLGTSSWTSPPGASHNHKI